MAVSPHTPSVVNQAEVAGAISSYFGVAPGDAAVARLLASIFPDVERAAARDPASWKSVVPGVLAKYESLAKDLGLGISPMQRERDAARLANPTSSARTEFGKHAGLAPISLPLGMREDSDGGK
jgi:hypothetical protein